MKDEKLYALLTKVAELVTANKFAYLISEQILYCLTDDEEFSELAEYCGADVSKMKDDLEDFMREQERITDLSKVLPTSEYQKTIEEAMALAKKGGQEGLTNAHHLVLALLNNGEDCFATYLLRSQGIDKKHVTQHMSVSCKGVSSKFTTDMVSCALKGKYSPLVGREAEIERIVQILHKKKTCNPLLVALPGVGKTAIVEGLAQKMAEESIPESLRGSKLWLLDMGSIMAGAKYKGEYEGRLKSVLDVAAKDKGVILFIDEIHSLCMSDGSVSGVELLKPYLAGGVVRVIGATTYDEYSKYILKDKAFARRFKKIDVNEPSREETLEILKGLRKSYEDYHKISYGDDVLEAIVNLSGQYVKEQCFPDKAIEVMDEIGSKYSSSLKRGDRCTVQDAEEVVASIAHVPSVSVKKDEMKLLKGLEERLRQEIYGQNEAIDKVVSHLKIAKAGLTDKGKPLGVFALVGSTGVGKTELVKQLASNLNTKFVKLDMSEYSEKNAVAKMIGTAPGYIGFEQSGSLTEPVIQNPNSVVLLDEIEKADKSIYNVLLQVMDEGRLTDNKNRVADFTQTMIFMTSNVGTANADRAKSSIGFAGDDLSSRRKSAFANGLKDEFPPEFRNRFTDIIQFNDLTQESYAMIVEKEIRKLNERLKDKDITVKVTEDAKKDIVERSMEENMGGRPVARIVETDIARKLVDEILFNNLKGQEVVFDKSAPDSIEIFCKKLKEQ